MKKAQRDMKILVVFLISLVINWPGPVLYSHHIVNNWVKSCSPAWQKNAEAFSKIDIRNGAYSYYENAKTFTSDWVSEEGAKPSDLTCFGNLWASHYQAIKAFDSQLDEYKRQIDLGAYLSPPVLYESFYKYTKVEHLCEAPSILGLQWKVTCKTFLNTL